MVKKVALGLVVLLAVLAAVVVVRTLMHRPVVQDLSAALPVPAAAPLAAADEALDGQALARQLAAAIPLRTVSHQDRDRFDAAAFEAFLGWMAETWPRVHGTLERTLVAQYTPLYRWAGSNPDLQPVLLTAHYDVVPVAAGSEERWQQPPWSGAIADGAVWGRGALDDKSAVVAQLAAVEALLAAGYQPRRTIYLAFGHDEEVGGGGAAAVAEHLRGQGVQLAWSLDEGSFLFDRLIPGVEPVMASINVAEKGSVTLELVARGDGGHSSMPPAETAVTRLAKALVALHAEPVPGGLDGLSAEMFDRMSRHMGFASRMAFANTWLFQGSIERQLAAVTFGNAMLRTTTAPTMLRGSAKSNVLPTEAAATVNFRIHPRDTVETVLAHVRTVVGSDHVSVRHSPGSGRNASPVASAGAAGFATVAAAVQAVYGDDTLVVPGLTIAATDSRHYGTVADNAYRLNPMVVGQDDLTGFHGTDEHIDIDNLLAGARTYLQILARAGG